MTQTMMIKKMRNDNDTFIQNNEIINFSDCNMEEDSTNATKNGSPRKTIKKGKNTSKCIGKEVATKYFLPGDLKLNLFLLGFPNYL